MKKLIFTLFACILTVGLFAQANFDGSEFDTMTPEQNAKSYTEYMTKTYKLTADQAKAVEAIRLRNAKHIAQLNKEPRDASIDQKKERIKQYDYRQVLSSLTAQQAAVFRSNQLNDDAKQRIEKFNVQPRKRSMN